MKRGILFTEKPCLGPVGTLKKQTLYQQGLEYFAVLYKILQPGWIKRNDEAMPNLMPKSMLVSLLRRHAIYRACRCIGPVSNMLAGEVWRGLQSAALKQLWPSNLRSIHPYQQRDGIMCWKRNLFICATKKILVCDGIQVVKMYLWTHAPGQGWGECDEVEGFFVAIALLHSTKAAKRCNIVAQLHRFIVYKNSKASSTYLT